MSSHRSDPNLLLKRASILVTIFAVANAHAGHPLIRTAVAIDNIRMATPVPFEQAFAANLVGLDQEHPDVRKSLLKQAGEYVEFRRGQSPKWPDKCHTENSKNEKNYFCLFEAKRRETSSASPKPSSRNDRVALASELRAGFYSAVENKTHAEIAAAVRQLDADRQLAAVAMSAADRKECVPPALTGAIAFKLEERFPAIEIVELTKRLYRKAVGCGAGFASAQAGFRLGLLQIWEDKCAEVSSLMLKVESVPEAGQLHARAKYWRYYCADRTGDKINREFARSALLKDHPMSFHALAAAAADDAMAEQVIRQPAPLVAFRSLVRADLNPVIRAAEALARTGAGSFGNRLAGEIIDHAVKELASMEPEVRLYLAVLMNRVGATLPKFKILNELFLDAPRTVSLQTLKLFFPLSYLEIVRHKQNQIDPLLILSLIRQESAFNKEARSIAGARGLMQVMPATARMVDRGRAALLNEPSVNIDVGTKYFISRLRQYEGDVELTLAAYNAGFNRVDDWRKRYPTDNRLLFLDFIPFRETRDYVSSILRNYYWYVILYSPQLLTETQHAATVTSKTGSIIGGNAGLAANVVTARAPASSRNDAAGK